MLKRFKDVENVASYIHGMVFELAEIADKESIYRYTSQSTRMFKGLELEDVGDPRPGDKIKLTGKHDWVGSIVRVVAYDVRYGDTTCNNPAPGIGEQHFTKFEFVDSDTPVKWIDQQGREWSENQETAATQKEVSKRKEEELEEVIEDKNRIIRESTLRTAQLEQDKIYLQNIINDNMFSYEKSLNDSEILSQKRYEGNLNLRNQLERSDAKLTSVREELDIRKNQLESMHKLVDRQCDLPLATIIKARTTRFFRRQWFNSDLRRAISYFGVGHGLISYIAFWVVVSSAVSSVLYPVPAHLYELNVWKQYEIRANAIQVIPGPKFDDPIVQAYYKDLVAKRNKKPSTWYGSLRERARNFAIDSPAMLCYHCGMVSRARMTRP